jgi:hypothetical protein
MLLHGAVISDGTYGYAFTADSGVGKTTHIKLWQKAFGKEISIVNGDKPIIHVTDECARVCSTPWAGKEGMQKNVSQDLCGIVILRRGAENRIKKIDPAQFFTAIMAQTYFPRDPEARMATLELVDKLSNVVDFYLLECNVSDEAAHTSFEFLR